MQKNGRTIFIPFSDPPGTIINRSVRAPDFSHKKNKRQYSKGEINRAIDSLLHPLFDRSPAFVAVDTVLHGLVERNPKVTIRKFARYILPKIIEEILKGH